jgi:hypothetical protein
MATTVNETDLTRIYGDRGLLVLYFTVVNTAAETTATISPGNGNGVIQSGSVGLRKILRWGFTDSVAAAAIRVVKAYSATTDRDELTLTFTAGDEIDGWVEGIDAGG